MNTLIILSLLPFISLASLPEHVVKCEDYIKEPSPICTNQGAGCVGKGWYSKANTDPKTRVNAIEICQSEGYTGVSTSQYGGNWGHQCRSPVSGNNSANKAGGDLTAFGYSVTWLCDDSTPSPTPGVESVVISCEEYSKKSDALCKNQGDGCVGEGWYSKDNVDDPFQRINILAWCQSEGYENVGLKGGNWGYICRFPGTNGNSNNAGGSLDAFGYTGTWQCVGGSTQSPTLSPTSLSPTLSPTTLPPASVDSVVVSCAEYSKKSDAKCKNQGDGCVGEGWYSKDNADEPFQRINILEWCKSEGYETVGTRGGNWGQTCRFPGTNGNSNNAGGSLEAFGYTGTWKCVSTTQSPTLSPTASLPPTLSPTSTLIPTLSPTDTSAEPTISPSNVDIDAVVVSCEEYSKKPDAECKNQGDGCVGAGWYSKDNADAPFQRIDAIAFCKGKGFDAVGQRGGNWAHQCRFPGYNGNANGAGGELTALGYTSTFECVKSTSPSSPIPTLSPTDSPTKFAIVECGEYSQKENAECKNMGDGCVGTGWYSKVNTVDPHKHVNAMAWCKNMGYENVGQYGGNWSNQCRFPGRSGNHNKAGGALTEFGFSVTWECVGPTESPTESSQSPTQSPTDSTQSPTQSPTDSPNPTSSPTLSPVSSLPTSSPTLSPVSSVPTSSPTLSPVSPDPTVSPTMSPSNVSSSTDSPTPLDCEAIDVQDLCELFPEECYWKAKNKGNGLCRNAPTGPKDICVLSDRIKYSDYSDACEKESEKKPCLKLGCKWKTGKPGSCIATKKPKCKKADKAECCKLAGCNIQDSGRKSKKCYKSKQDKWN